MKPPIRQWLKVILLFVLTWNLSIAIAEDDTEAAATNGAAPATVPTLPTYSNEALLAQMLVTDISERALDGLPALTVTFSQNLAPTGDYNNFITVTSGGKRVEGSWILGSEPRRLYFTNITPQTDYRIQVRPGIASKNALQLQQPFDFSVKTRDVQPSFDFATRGTILPTNLATGLPIRVVNIPELDIEFLRVKPEKLSDMLKSLSAGERVTKWQLDDINAVTESVYSTRYVTDVKPNARTALNIPIGTIKALQAPGLYFAIMHQPGRFNDDSYKVTQFFVTNIGLHVRAYSGSVEVFANTLDTGKPLEGVELKLQGEKETLSVNTNAEGRASFTTRPTGNLLLVALQGEQFAFLDMREAALDLSEYKVSGADDKPITPFIYSPRDLYRPAEFMDISVLLRDRDGKLVDINNLNLKVVRPDTKTLLEQNVVTANPALGYFNYRLAIPSDAPTGAWKVEVRMNAKDSEPAASFGFHVEEFMPERMKLALTSQVPVLSPNQKLNVSVQGDYLYGAPASGNKFTAVRTVALDRHPLEKLKEYYFGNPADEKWVGREDLPEAVLDEKGALALEVPALEGKINSPLSVGVIGSLFETGGRTVTRKLDVPLWPANNLIGIRPAFKNDTTPNDSTTSFDLIRVNAAGQVALLNQPVAVTLVREEKEYFWEYNSSEGWQRKDLSTEYPLTQQKVTFNGQSQAKVSFPVQYGYYRLEVEDPETGLKAVYPFHAGWDWEQSENNAARPDQIELALDKAAYKAGDTAQLKITPPAAGEAIVAVEGGTLLWSQRVSLPAEGTTVSIPVDAAWARHDLYVTVTSFRPASTEKKISPNRAIGVVYLPLDRSDRQVALSIEAPEKVRPEQTASVTVTATNLQNQSAVVTLAAVDVGVLNITDFKTPDPFKFFFSQHAYHADMYDAYGKIIEGVEGATLRQRFGGDALLKKGGAYAKPDLKIVSLFSGAVAFDAEGKAKINLPIPAFDGAVRLMAVAAGADRFGSAERDMKIASPVVASLAAPRFLAAGDSSTLTVDLNNTLPEDTTVHVKIAASPMLGIAAMEKDIVLTKGKRETLRLPMTAQQMFGLGYVNLQLTGKDFIANRQLQVSVRPAYPSKQVVLSREIPVGQSVRLDSGLLQGLLPAGASANLSLAATPPLPVQSALQGLLQYPYGCLEQTTSTAWPYLFLEPEVAEQLALKPMEMKERNERVTAALLRLAGMQLSNGGFTLWENGNDEDYWLSPYVTDFLLDAKERGFAVPEWMLQQALKNLQERLQEGERYVDERYEFSDEPNHLDVAARAYAGYVLSRVKQAPLGTLRVIYDQDAAKVKSSLPLVHLGLALIAQGDKARGDAAIQRGLNMARDKDQYYGDYGSQLRDQAAILYLLMKNKVAVPALPEQVKKLATLTRDAQYLSTQEQLFVFMANKELQAKAKEGWKANLTIGKNAVSLSGTAPLYRSISMDDLKNGVQVTSQGSKLLYLGFSADAYPATAPAVKQDAIKVSRQWYDLKGKKIEPANIKAGMLLLTHVEAVSNTDMRDALLVDLVPAGLEVENTNLADNESIDGLQLEGMDKPVSDLLEGTTVHHQEFRDDRYVAAISLNAKEKTHLFYLVRAVSSGNFTVPPPYATDMYRPELYGIGVAPAGLSIP